MPGQAKGGKTAQHSSLLDLLCCCCFGSGSQKRPIRSSVTDWRTHPIVLQYRLIEVIGEGGFSEVWLAQHLVTGDRAALKVVYLSKPGLDKEQAAVLEGEAKFLQLLDHPNIIHCRAVLETKYDLVLVLEHLPGGELLDHLHLVQHCDEAQAAQLFRQVVDAVAHMHDLNIMHRDIKPENVMFVRPVQWYHSHKQPIQVKLIDFGMAAVFRNGHSYTGCLGSPGFIAPEVVRGGEHTPAMDIYALGVLLFVLLTGRKPHDLRDVRSFAYASIPIRSALGLQDARFTSCSKDVQELVLWMMADNPGKRPSARQVLKHVWVQGQSHSASRLVIDSVVRRRMQQLANLRRYKGLAFALMMNTDDAGYHHAHSITSRHSSSSSQTSLVAGTPHTHLSRHSRLWYLPSDVGSCLDKDIFGDGQLSSPAANGEGPQHRCSTPAGISNSPHSSPHCAPALKMRTAGAVLELATTSCPAAKVQTRHLRASSVGSSLKGLDGGSREVVECQSPQSMSRMDSPSGSTCMLRHAPEPLLRAIQQQRKLIHQEMKSRARIRHQAEQQQQQGSTGREADGTTSNAAGLLAAITEEGTSVRSGRLVHIGRQLSQALTRKLSAVLTPTSHASLGNTSQAANPLTGSPATRFGSGRLTASPDRLSKDRQRPPAVEVVNGFSIGRSHDPAPWATAQLPTPSSCGSQQLLLPQVDESCCVHADRPSRISCASLSSAPSQTSEQPLLGGLGLQHHTPPSDNAFHLLRGTSPCTSAVHGPFNTSREHDPSRCSHVAAAPAAGRPPGAAEGMDHVGVRDCAWHELAAPVRTITAANGGRACHQNPSHSSKQHHRSSTHQQAQQQLMMDLTLVATALRAAPQLERCWTAPEPGTVPNVFENAIGAAAPRVQASMEQAAQQPRALSLDMLALAFLDGEQQLRQMLGDAAADMVINYAALGRTQSAQTAGGASQTRTGSGGGSAVDVTDTSADLEQYPYVQALLACSPASSPHLMLDTPHSLVSRSGILVQPLQASSYLTAAQGSATPVGGASSLAGLRRDGSWQDAHVLAGGPSHSAGSAFWLPHTSRELHLCLGPLGEHALGTQLSSSVAIPVAMQRYTTSPFPAPPPDCNHVRALARRPSWIEHSARVRHGTSPLGIPWATTVALPAHGSGRLLHGAISAVGMVEGSPIGSTPRGASEHGSIGGPQHEMHTDAEAAVRSAIAIIPPSARRGAASAFEALSYLPFSWASNSLPHQPPHPLSRISSASSRSGSSSSSNSDDDKGSVLDVQISTPTPTPVPSFGHLQNNTHAACAGPAAAAMQRRDGQHETGAACGLQLRSSMDGSLYLVPSDSHASLHMYPTQCHSPCHSLCGVEAAQPAQGALQPQLCTQDEAGMEAAAMQLQFGIQDAPGEEAATLRPELAQPSECGSDELLCIWPGSSDQQRSSSSTGAAASTFDGMAGAAAVGGPFSQQHDSKEECEMCSDRLPHMQLTSAVCHTAEAAAPQQTGQGYHEQLVSIRPRSSQPIPVPMANTHQTTLRPAEPDTITARSGSRGTLLGASMSLGQEAFVLGDCGSPDV